jgi:hypothetical protein
MASKGWKYSSIRASLLGASAALVLASACGSNPELVPATTPIDAGAGLGEACENNEDCSSSLCSRGVCVARCGEVTSASCGREACLPSGLCSTGLGRDCTDSSECSDGLSCSTLGHCAAPCESGEDRVCKNNEVCRADGTCPTESDLVIGTGGAGPDPGGEAGAPGCIDVEVTFEPQIPTVLLLIDRSGSMDASGFGSAVERAVEEGSYELGDCPSNNDWRWNVVRDVLMNPAKGIVKPLEDRVRFGLSLYSSRNGQVLQGQPEEVDPDKMCPELIEVPIALSNHQAMLDQFQCSDISEDTPTGESLLAAASTLNAYDEPGPKVIVLATDGEPDTCECPDFGGAVPDKCKEDGVPQRIQEEVVAIAQGILADDITVHVINVSTPGNASLQRHLEEVAAAGGGEVYPGFSPGALSDAFEDIINGVRSCKIDLDGEIATGKESSGKVTLDGDLLELDAPDGWQVNTPSQIELLGAACEAIKSGGHDLSISFPCGTFDPVVE